MKKWALILLLPTIFYGYISMRGSAPHKENKEGGYRGKWSKEKQEQLTKCADRVYDQQLSAYPSFHYPFSGIKKIRLKEQKRETVAVFSYGSLINLRSACKVLDKSSLETRQPAIAFGVIRLFNYDPKKTSLGPPKDLEYRAMLNMEKTNRAENLVNGVVIEVPRESLTELCEREIGYDLVPVLYTLWEEALELQSPACPTFKVAYAFIAPEEVAGGESRVNWDIKPRPDYFQLVKEGATEYGPDYLKLFLQTTYTADRKPV